MKSNKVGLLMNSAVQFRFAICVFLIWGGLSGASWSGTGGNAAGDVAAMPVLIPLRDMLADTGGSGLATDIYVQVMAQMDQPPGEQLVLDVTLTNAGPNRVEIKNPWKALVVVIHDASNRLVSLPGVWAPSQPDVAGPPTAADRTRMLRLLSARIGGADADTLADARYVTLPAQTACEMRVGVERIASSVVVPEALADQGVPIPPGLYQIKLGLILQVKGGAMRMLEADMFTVRFRM